MYSVIPNSLVRVFVSVRSDCFDRSGLVEAVKVGAGGGLTVATAGFLPTGVAGESDERASVCGSLPLLRVESSPGSSIPVGMWVCECVRV